jgi:hypothetical protein
MMYDDSCWACVLDNHLKEEEEELAELVGEEAVERGHGFMGVFMLYAAPTFSEDEDPRTVRWPTAKSSQESSFGHG